MAFFKNKFLFFHLWKDYSGFLVNRVGLVAKSCPTLLWPPWAAAHQAPLSMGFPRREYWSGLPFPSPGDLPNPGIEPKYPALAGGFFITEPPGTPFWSIYYITKSFISERTAIILGEKMTIYLLYGKCGSWGRVGLSLPLSSFAYPSPNIPNNIPMITQGSL